jgi:hypothetical protein
MAECMWCKHKTPNITVLWSGGIDSTYLIYKLLKEGYSVDAWYVEIINNRNKTQHELKAIDNLTNLLKQHGDFSYRGILYRAEVKSYGYGLCITHPILFINAIQFLPKEVTKVALGYIFHDDMLSYLEEFKDLNKAYSYFRFDEWQPAEIVFPIKRCSKSAIIEILPEEIFLSTWFCEGDLKTGELCEKCYPCEKFLDITTGCSPKAAIKVKKYKEYKKFNIDENKTVGEFLYGVVGSVGEIKAKDISEKVEITEAIKIIDKAEIELIEKTNPHKYVLDVLKNLTLFIGNSDRSDKLKEKIYDLIYSINLDTSTALEQDVTLENYLKALGNYSSLPEYIDAAILKVETEFNSSNECIAESEINFEI